jgi:hypothetical protein
MTARAFAGVSCQRELILPIIATLIERKKERERERERERETERDRGSSRIS